MMQRICYGAHDRRGQWNNRPLRRERTELQKPAGVVLQAVPTREQSHDYPSLI